MWGSIGIDLSGAESLSPSSEAPKTTAASRLAEPRGMPFRYFAEASNSIGNGEAGPEIETGIDLQHTQ
jgi:hypothetical protein